MGVSTDGQLSYGCLFEEGFEFPWDKEKYDGDTDAWWEDVRGFTSTVDYPYDEFGEYKEGFNSNSPEVTKYFDEVLKWHRANPLPVKLVNYCSREYPMYILSSKNLKANRGYPEKVSVDFLRETEEAHSSLVSFMTEFGIDYQDGEIGWWLSSFWG